MGESDWQIDLCDVADMQTIPNAAPIGVFDSGIGGLTVLRELLRELPDERYIYFGDTGNCPYGVRPDAEIERLALNAAEFLIRRGAKAIVVACNTASVRARELLRAVYPTIPVVVVVPAVKPAAGYTHNGKIGVAATTASARSAYLRELIAAYAKGLNVLPVGCPQLVELAEQGILDGPVVERAIRQELAPLIAGGIDTLVLGCTHFPAQRAAFERVLGPGVAVIDSGAAVANRTRAVLERDGLLANPGGGPAKEPRPARPDDEFWRSGAADNLARVAIALLGPIPTVQFAEGMILEPVGR
ncbi:MAG: glutamate racemase [Ktedonobacterales bacterium]